MKNQRKRDLSVRLWQEFKEETKDIVMSIDSEQLEYNIWLIDKIFEMDELLKSHLKN